MKKKGTNKETVKSEQETSVEQSASKEKKEEKTVVKTDKELLGEALQEIEILKNKYVMVFADMENARKHNERSLNDALKYRASGFVESLIPALDAFRLALNGQVTSDVVKNYLIGFNHVYKNILQALESEGVKEIVPNVNDRFDYKIMHAIDTEDSELEPDRVTKVVTSAFMLKDRLLRPAMVVLSRKKAVPPAAEEPDGKNNQESPEKTDA